MFNNITYYWIEWVKFKYQRFNYRINIHKIEAILERWILQESVSFRKLSVLNGWNFGASCNIRIVKALAPSSTFALKWTVVPLVIGSYNLYDSDRGLNKGIVIV